MATQELPKGMKMFSAKVFGEDFPENVAVYGRDLAADSHMREWVPKLNPSYRFPKEKLTVVLNFLTQQWTGFTNDALHLVGPTGSGKTSLLEQVCARLDSPMVSVTGHERMEVAELISSITAINGSTMTVDGPLTMAMREGAVFVINEIDLMDPGTLTGLNDIIERGFVVIASTNELVRAAPGFAFVATSNTGGAGDEFASYVGTRILNVAFRDRFTTIRVDYMPKEEELAMLAQAMPDVDKTVFPVFVDTANLVRDAYKSGSGLSVPMSTRTLIRWVRHTVTYQGMAQKGVTPIFYALDLAIGNNLTEAERTSLHEMLKQTSGLSPTI